MPPSAETQHSTAHAQHGERTNTSVLVPDWSPLRASRALGRWPRNPRRRIGLRRCGCWAWTLATLHDWTPWPVRTAKGCRRTRRSRCKQRHPLRFCRSSPSSSPPPSPLPVPALDDLPSPSDQSQGLPGPPPPPSAPSAAAALLFFASAAFFPRSSHSSLVRRPAHDALRQQSSRLPSARVRIFSTAEPRNISRPSVSSHYPRRV